MFKIMKHNKTLETNADSQTVRAYRECVPNITIEDESNKINQASDRELSELYGVSTRRELESAFNLTLCAIGGALCVILAILTQ